MSLSCVFKINQPFGERHYSCNIFSQKLPTEELITLVGAHEKGKTNDDVTGLFFHQCKMTKVPAGFTQVFKNLKVLSIRSSNLKILSNHDMDEYKNLEQFYCEENFNIFYLPGNLFKGFKNLRKISFYNEMLKLIDSNILDNLCNLEYVDFRGSGQSNYQFFFTNSNVHKGNMSLDKLKIKLDEEFNKNQNLCFKITQNESKSLSTDIKRFLAENESFKDFRIIIDGQEFPVHKFLLAARSPTLAEILKNNPEVENLNLVDISVEIFEIILKFLYTDELPGEDGTNFLHLFAAAGKLKIDELKDFAAEKIIKMTNSGTALEALKLGNKYEHEGLTRKAFHEVKKKYPKIEFEDEWMNNFNKISEIIYAYEKMQDEMKKLEEKFNLMLHGK